jgi:putative endopeptidase
LPRLVLATLLALAACHRIPGPGDGTARAPVPPRAEAGPVQPLPAIDESALDRTVAPCEDFYAFACGGWISRNEIPPDKPRWNRGFDTLREQNLAVLRTILDAEAEGKVDPRDRFAEKVADYYASCMDQAAVEARGLHDLRAEWARLDAVEDRGALAGEIARLTSAGIAAPFQVTSDQDAKDATQVIGIVTQGGLSLPDRDYYLSDDPKMAAIRARYGEHLRRMHELAGLSPADAAARAKIIAELERSLAETHWTRTERRDPKRVYNRVDRAGLEKLAPAFPWAHYFEAIGHPEVTAVSVTTPRFVERVGQLYAGKPLDTWKAYLEWHLLREMTRERAVPKAFVDEAFVFSSESFTGAKELQPRWKKCVQSTDEALGEALGQTYVRLHFGEEGKARTSLLVRELEAAMGRDLDAIPWMDDATRAKAKEKLARIANKVGFPGRWRDYGSMSVDRRSYFGNVLAAGRFEVNRRLAKIGKPLDRTEWLMSPPTVNAYYSPPMNEIVFPAGILQPPFFNPTAPEAVNYGAIGMVVGHELTHGFDDAGRQYDAFGNLSDWWSQSVSAEFEVRAQCLVDQFGGYETLPGVKLNGKLTEGENIADLGGVKLSYAAMQAARRERPPGGGDGTVAGFTPEQQFFLGYAQAWCEKVREPYARMLAATDPHSPPRHRVNGPLANFPEFAKAFSCAPGAAMVRPGTSRCQVW